MNFGQVKTSANRVLVRSGASIYAPMRVPTSGTGVALAARSRRRRLDLSAVRSQIHPRSIPRTHVQPYVRTAQRLRL